jgi:hypothetical protein
MTEIPGTSAGAAEDLAVNDHSGANPAAPADSMPSHRGWEIAPSYVHERLATRAPCAFA